MQTDGQQPVVAREDRDLARPRWHLAVALGLGVIQYRRTGRILPAIAPLVSGFLVDGDHFLDYALYKLTAQREAERATRRMVLPLHAWEFLLPMALLETVTLRGEKSTDHGLTLGYLAHLLVDHFNNEPVDPLAYSLVHRISRKFDGPFFKPKPSRAWREESLTSLWHWL